MFANIYDFGIQNVDKRDTWHTLHIHVPPPYKQIEMQCGHYGACAIYGLSAGKNGKSCNVAHCDSIRIFASVRIFIATDVSYPIFKE